MATADVKSLLDKLPNWVAVLVVVVSVVVNYTMLTAQVDQNTEARKEVMDHATRITRIEGQTERIKELENDIKHIRSRIDDIFENYDLKKKK